MRIHANANQVLDEADTAYDAFLAAVHQRPPKSATNSPRNTQRSRGRRYRRPSMRLARSTSPNINTIIWATGYTYDFGWMNLPVFDQRGRPAQHRGVTQQPGLYFLGLHWMHTFNSGLLAGVGSDAEYLADHIAQRC